MTQNKKERTHWILPMCPFPSLISCSTHRSQLYSKLHTTSVSCMYSNIFLPKNSLKVDLQIIIHSDEDRVLFIILPRKIIKSGKQCLHFIKPNIREVRSIQDNHVFTPKSVISTQLLTFPPCSVVLMQLNHYFCHYIDILNQWLLL